jgi:hypothetical protein
MVVGGVSNCGEVEGGECEEAERTKLSDIFSLGRKPEKSPKEETS